MLDSIFFLSYVDYTVHLSITSCLERCYLTAVSLAAMKQPLPGETVVLPRSLSQEQWLLSSWYVCDFDSLFVIIADI